MSAKKENVPPTILFAMDITPESIEAGFEKHGFVAVKFGISPPPESAPDVEYAWSVH